MTKEQKIRKEIKQIVDEIPKEDIEDRVKQDEQEEAMERCKELIKPEHANWIGISNQEAIRELLNILKEKYEMIEFQKDINRIEKDRHKKTEKSLKGQIIKNNKIIEKLEKEAQGYFEENIKKDKIIDLMAEEINNSDFNTCPCIDYGIDLDCENRCNDNYKECWKQYFKSKAEKE